MSVHRDRVLLASQPVLGSEIDMSRHFRELQQLQTEVLRRSPEDQQRVQPMLRQAEKRACGKLQEDQRKGVKPEAYYRQGGAELLAIIMQFSHYCETVLVR